MSDYFRENTTIWSLVLLTSFAMFSQRVLADDPAIVAGAAADIQYADRIPGPHPHDIRSWYNTSHIRLDEMIGD